MKTIFLGKNCIEVEQTDSTNDYLARLAASGSFPNGMGAFEGTIVSARQQLQGRGQRGTSWESEPDKNLTLSILLQPTFLRPEDQFQLNKAVSLGVAEFVVGCLSPSGGGREEDVKIKWPNDIYIADKKVAGILIENAVSGNKLQQSIIGVGININQERFSAELPNPTSLKLVMGLHPFGAGKEFDLKVCLEELCSCIEKRYLQLRHPHSGPLPQGEGGSQTAIDADYLKNLYRFDEWGNYTYKGNLDNYRELKAKITGVTKIGKLILETEKREILECDFKEIKYNW